MSKENEAVILSAARTPIARFQGALSSVPGTKLGAVAVKATVERAGIDNKEDIDEVFMGMVVPAGQGQAPARQAAIFAGLPPTVSATTFNKVCGSGLKTAMLASQAIKAGDGQLRARRIERLPAPRRTVGPVRGLGHGQRRRLYRRGVRGHA